MEPVQGARRRQVVELVRAACRPLSARQIAGELGLHGNTVRFHLDALVGEGVLRREEGTTGGPGRPASRYLLVPGMDRGGTRNYRLLAEMLLSHLAAAPDPTGAAVRAGEEWGRYLVEPAAPGRHLGADEGVRRLTDLLAGIGFDPRAVPSTSAGSVARVELRHCPFLELAEAQRSLVCSLHLGLMRGALDRLAVPVRAVSLEPFAEPHLCIAQLGRRPDPSTGATE